MILLKRTINQVGDSVRNTNASHITMEKIRVAYVVYPKGYFDEPVEQTPLFKRQSVRFVEASARKASFSGFIEHVDPLHLYTMECTKQMSLTRRNVQHQSPEYTITRVINVERVILERGVLCELACRFGGLTALAAQNATMSMNSSAIAGHCGSIVREVGDTPWYQCLEKKFPLYFSLWYIDELSRNAGADNTTECFNQAALSSMSTTDVYRLIRIVIKEPWKMCFWWLHQLPLIDELSATAATTLAQRFGHTSTVTNDYMWEAAHAYSTYPFGHARDVGNSYITMNEFANAIPDSLMRAAFIKNNIVEIVKVVDSANITHCYAGVIGDRKCEEEVANLITEIVTTNSDTDVVVFPQESCWPWLGGDAELLTPEQRQTLTMARERRLVNIVGIPGCGKTSFVLRSIASMYPRGKVIGVAFTGMAAQKLHNTINTGHTAHHIIDRFHRCGCDTAHPKYEFIGYTTLIIEEASNMSIKLIRRLLIALGGSKTLRRVIITGDPRQMPPPNGGSSLLMALAIQYKDTPLAIELVQSKRIADETGAYARNLDAIITYNKTLRVSPPIMAIDPLEKMLACYPKLNLEWSNNPNTAASLVFLRRGRNESETVEVMRKALLCSGVHPDDPNSDYYITTHTNDQIAKLAVPWYNTSAVAKVVPQYRRHDFHVGERVMFLENNNGGSPKGSKLTSDRIMNGTTGCISDIFDEEMCFAPPANAIPSPLPRKRANKKSTDPPSLPNTTRVDDTASPQTYKKCVRWLRIAPPLDAMISLDFYKKKNIVRACPATVAKLQGQEASIVVIYLDGSELERRTYSRRELYTACSRGKQRCIVIGGITDAPPQSEPVIQPCVDPDFIRIVANHSVYASHTNMCAKFPSFETIDALTKTTPTVSHSNRTKHSLHTKTDSDDDQ